MTRQSDGKIIFVGGTATSPQDMAVVRVNVDGSRDLGFKLDGDNSGAVGTSFYPFDWPGAPEEAFAVAIQPAAFTGKNQDMIIVAGRASHCQNPPEPSKFVFALMRFYTTDVPPNGPFAGDLDTGWGAGGLYDDPLSPLCNNAQKKPGRVAITFQHPVRPGGFMREGHAFGLAVSPVNGKVVVVGYAGFGIEEGVSPPRGNLLAVAQLLADGTEDPDFGDVFPPPYDTNRSEKLVDVGIDEEIEQAHAVALLPTVGGEHPIIVAGMTLLAPAVGKDFVIVKLHENDGAELWRTVVDLDPDPASSPIYEDIAWDVILQNLGGVNKILVVGESGLRPQLDPGEGDLPSVDLMPSDFSMVRVCPDTGLLDTGLPCGSPGFGSGGKRTYHVGWDDVAYGADLQPQTIGPARIVFAGYTRTTASSVPYVSGARIDAHASATTLTERFNSTFSGSAGQGDQARAGILVEPDPPPANDHARKINLGGFHSTSSTASGFAAMRVCINPDTECGSLNAPGSGGDFAAFSTAIGYENAVVPSAIGFQSPEEKQYIAGMTVGLFEPDDQDRMALPASDMRSVTLQRTAESKPFTIDLAFSLAPERNAMDLLTESY